jgi:acyl carrier protein
MDLLKASSPGHERTDAQVGATEFSMSDESTMTQTTATAANIESLMAEVADMIVAALNLEITGAEIQPDERLFGEGLGLDSIDILEVALVVSKHYGFQLRADDEDNVRIFTSLRSLTSHIATHRTQ